MKHLGDITKIHGWDIEPVDIIVGGSPCQDLSVAGKRKGLDGERSGLFMEQIRIIKEMRAYESEVRGRPAHLVRPRFCVWENVPGAFSSNKGEDFRIVLEEFCKIADPEVSVPGPPNGKWEPAGCIMGEGYSVAWRTHSAELWSVPQRRKRISVVVSFGATNAAELLFEQIPSQPEGVSGDTQPGRAARKTAAGEASDGSCGSVGTPPGASAQSHRGGRHGDNPAAVTLKVRGGVERDSNGRAAGKGALIQNELSATLGVSQDQTLFVLEGNGSRDSHRGDGFAESETSYTLNTVEQHGVCYNISPYASNSMKSDNPHSDIQQIDTIRTLDLNGGSPACNQGGTMVVEPYGVDLYNQALTGNVSKTLNSVSSDADHVPCVVEPIVLEERERELRRDSARNTVRQREE